jgi:hypothetical protein
MAIGPIVPARLNWVTSGGRGPREASPVYLRQPTSIPAAKISHSGQQRTLPYSLKDQLSRWRSLLMISLRTSAYSWITRRASSSRRDKLGLGASLSGSGLSGGFMRPRCH